MAAIVTGSNPAYTLQSVLTAQLASHPQSAPRPTPPPAANASSGHAAPAPTSTTSAVPTNLAAHGVGGSVNHQG